MDSCQENSMGRGAWQATVHGAAKSWTWLSTHTQEMELTFLASDLWSTICTCCRSLSDVSRNPATILPLIILANLNGILIESKARFKHWAGSMQKKWPTQNFIPWSKAGFLPPELHCKEQTESVKWRKLWSYQTQRQGQAELVMTETWGSVLSMGWTWL